MMPITQDPVVAYRRIELDARIEGSDALGLTRICLDTSIAELRRAHLAHSLGNGPVRNDALARAASGIAALHRGVAADNPLRGALRTLYGSAEQSVRLAMAEYRPDVLERVIQDMQDIRALL